MLLQEDNNWESKPDKSEEEDGCLWLFYQLLREKHKDDTGL